MRIIYISGIDGCGKTTQAEKLVESLHSKGINAEYQWLRWEPSIVNALKALKKLFGKNTKSSASAIENNEKADDRWHGFKQRLMKSGTFRRIWLHYASNDYYNSYKKAKQLWKSDIVIMDRYIFDFIADQSINFNIPAYEMATQFSGTRLADMHQPDYNIIIDIPAETGFKRKMDGTSLSHLKQREEIYKNKSGDNVVHIDGHLPITEIQEQIYKWLSDRMEIS